jgi:hypothetical protein
MDKRAARREKALAVSREGEGVEAALPLFDLAAPFTAGRVPQADAGIALGGSKELAIRGKGQAEDADQVNAVPFLEVLP